MMKTILIKTLIFFPTATMSSCVQDKHGTENDFFNSSKLVRISSNLFPVSASLNILIQAPLEACFTIRIMCNLKQTIFLN